MEGLTVEPLLIQLKDYYKLVPICILNQNSLPLYLKWGHHVANLELLKGDDTVNKHFLWSFYDILSMLHWIECFLAQHTLQDLHRILI